MVTLSTSLLHACLAMTLTSMTVTAYSTVSTATVWSPGQGNYPCIRIPAILLAPDGTTLLAWAEGRHWVGDGCEPSHPVPVPSGSTHTDIVFKRSTDGGKTWSNITTLVPNGSQPTAVASASTVVLSYLADYKTNEQIISKDNGLTWSSPQPLASFLGDQDNTDSGPGVGLRLRANNPHAPNRLLFIGHHGAYQHDVVWYSDDQGTTYKVSTPLLQHMDEAQLVELSDGSVVANMRNSHYNKTCDCRAQALSKDGGATFGPITYVPALISPVCQASILSSQDGKSLYFSNPHTKSGRLHGVIQESSDDGATWEPVINVTSATGGYAYSCLTHTPAGTGSIGLLYETTGPDCLGPSCQSVFSVYM